MNFRVPYRGREILNVRSRPRNTLSIKRPLYEVKIHFAAFIQKNNICYYGRICIILGSASFGAECSEDATRRE